MSSGTSETEVTNTEGTSTNQRASHYETFPMACSDVTAKSRLPCCRGVRLPPFRVMVTLVACVMVEATMGVTYTTGNMMPYVTSYLRNVTQETTLDYSQSLWIGNSLFLVLAVSVAALGLLHRCLPHRVVMLIGLVVNALSFFGAYWAVQWSFVATVVVFGVVQGFGQAILYPGYLHLALQWFPGHRGLVGGLAMGGYGGGAFIWNQLMTLWVNPDNLQPDLTVGDSVYFTQQEVLQRVPSCFLFLGGVLTGVQIICLLVVIYPPVNSASPADSGTSSAVTENEKNTTDEEYSKEEMPAGVDQGETLSKTSTQTETSSTTTVSYSPLQVVTSRVAWTLWLCNFMVDLSFFFVPAFYKTYGQTFIADDHLLSLIASTAAVFNALSRPVWGLLSDRIGYLPCLLINQGLLGVLTASLVLSEMAGSAAMFFVWISAIYTCLGGIYALQAPVVFTLFGPAHFVFSLGVVGSTGAISSFVTVPLATAVSEAFGWRGIFFVAASGAFLSVFILSSLLVSCGHPIPSHMRTGLLSSRRHTTNRRTNAPTKYFSTENA